MTPETRSVTVNVPELDVNMVPPPVDRSNFAQRARDLLEAAEEHARQRQHASGRKTARERIAILVDQDSFQEMDRFAGGDIDQGNLGSAVITGLGRVSGRLIAIYAQDFSVAGGTLGEVEGMKISHLMATAMRLRIPVISLLDSGGARIQEGVAALAQYGHLFKAITDASGVIPQISVILGPCAGGAVYGPALTDFIIMTKHKSFMFVTGPSVVKAVTGEDISSEELGGGDIHTVRSGVAHFLADDEDDALDYAKALLSYLPSNCTEKPPIYAYEEDQETTRISESVADLVPVSGKQPYDMRTVIQSLADHGEFLEVQEGFAANIVVGFACFNGHCAGVVANQPMVDAGTLDVSASEKAARFVQMCDAFSLPIVTLVDVPGYRPGSEQERAGIIRRGAKLLSAYAMATVPMVTVILRKAFGGAFIVMGSKSLGADFNFAWPAAEIAVMGSEGAVDIIYRKELAAAGAAGEDVVQKRMHFQAMYDRLTVNPNLSLKKGELDGLIEPRDTRRVIVRALEDLQHKDRTTSSPRFHDNAPM